MIAGVSIREKRIPEVVSIGVKDSKMLSARQRTRLAAEIRKIAQDISTVELQPKEIDGFVIDGRKLRKLNYLEATAMATVIGRLNPTVAYVDSSDVLPKRYATDIQSHLPRRIKIVSEHHADRKYPVVSAASIIAKVTRDQRIDELAARYGSFGSGYPSDDRTIRFLREWMASHGSFPAFVRKSWKTIARLEQEPGQTKL